MIKQLSGDMTVIALAPHHPLIRDTLTDAMRHIVSMHHNLAQQPDGGQEDAGWRTALDDLLTAISDLHDHDDDRSFAIGCAREALAQIAERDLIL